jgi:hypothetical protein
LPKREWVGGEKTNKNNPREYHNKNPDTPPAMNKIYKTFLEIYKYYRRIFFRNLFIMGFLGFQTSYYISQNPVLRRIYKFLFFKRPRNVKDILVEPTVNRWICISSIQPIAPTVIGCAPTGIFGFHSSAAAVIEPAFRLKEQYVYDFSEMVVGLKKECEKSYLITYSFATSAAEVDAESEKVFRVIRTRPVDLVDILEPKLSSVSLVDIQYHHPDMKESLILEIPREWFCIGNEMFTPEFILRVLYYQPLPFVFDMRYTLEVMDNDLNMITMDSTQKMVLNDSGYVVV